MKLFFLGYYGSGSLDTIITGAVHGLRLLEMQPASSNKHISSSTNFWYLIEKGYGFHAIYGPVFGISISNMLVLPTSVADLGTMLRDSFSSKKESLFLASCETCVSCNTMGLFFNSWCSS